MTDVINVEDHRLSTRERHWLRQIATRLKDRDHPYHQAAERYFDSPRKLPELHHRVDRGDL